MKGELVLYSTISIVAVILYLMMSELIYIVIEYLKYTRNKKKIDKAINGDKYWQA